MFDADDCGIPDADGILCDGSPDHVMATCGCGHRWRLQGVIQITDLQSQEAQP